MTVTPKVCIYTPAFMLQVLLKDGLESHFLYWEDEPHRFVLPLDPKYAAGAKGIALLRAGVIVWYNCCSRTHSPVNA